METKQCTDCKQEKSLVEYHRSKPRKDGSYGLRSICKTCFRKQNLDVYFNKGGKEKQKERSFKNNLKRYGITPEDYQILLNNQKGVCYICSTNQVSRSRVTYNLFVDHDHKTGKVRGLLCHHCNAGLGHFRDSSKLLLKAVEYLNENRS